MANKSVKIVAFYGSTRPTRNVDRVGEFAKQTINNLGLGIDLHVIDPMKLPFYILQLPLHWMPNQNDAPTWLRETNALIKSADGFLILASEYNATIPPALTNMMDHFSPASYRHKPVAIISYSLGTHGGARSQAALLPFLNELGCIPLPTNMEIPTVTQTVEADGTCKQEQFVSRMGKLLKQLEWYSTALKQQHEVRPIPEPSGEYDIVLF